MSTALQAEADRRWEDLQTLRDFYPEFRPFLIDCMTQLMGFECSDIQQDMGDYLQYGPTNLMIQAQRSQAKTTIVAIFVVWSWIHDPTTRALVVSAGGVVASEIAGWIIQIVMNWDILACLRPDKGHGDRASTQSFDVHWLLKGPEKSPSAACLGITASKQGRRADILIADDIESSENGATAEQREKLVHLSKDFTSICQNGRIIYLGTPQTEDSIYNNLPARGFDVRIWTGRYPTPEQMEDYSNNLAPLLKDRVLADPSLQMGGGLTGDQGKPTDPLLLGEEKLREKELDQGKAYFQLQHMLNTKLTDEQRYPLKIRNLITAEFPLEHGPGDIKWMPDQQKRLRLTGFPDNLELFPPHSMTADLYRWEGIGMYVDPAGGGKNGDETVGVVVKFIHGFLYVAEMLALPGGFAEEGFNALSDLAIKHKVNKVIVEENFGKGAFAQMWRPILRTRALAANLDGPPPVEDLWESGQKELRIAETLEPLMARHRLIIPESVWRYDIESVQKYPVTDRPSFMLCHQLPKLTRDRDSLIHDDRLDALAGACRIFVDKMAIDEQQKIEEKYINENVEFINSWKNGDPNKMEPGQLPGPKYAMGIGRVGKRAKTRKRRR